MKLNSIFVVDRWNIISSRHRILNDYFTPTIAISVLRNPLLSDAEAQWVNQKSILIACPAAAASTTGEPAIRMRTVRPTASRETCWFTWRFCYNTWLLVSKRFVLYLFRTRECHFLYSLNRETHSQLALKQNVDFRVAITKEATPQRSGHERKKR